jgi:branched-subunit amino acid ABC-type transport system permease component
MVAAIFMITLEGVVTVLWSPSWSVVVFYGALVVVLAFRPQGLLGRKAARAQ